MLLNFINIFCEYLNISKDDDLVIFPQQSLRCVVKTTKIDDQQTNKLTFQIEERKSRKIINFRQKIVDIKIKAGANILYRNNLLVLDEDLSIFTDMLIDEIDCVIFLLDDRQPWLFRKFDEELNFYGVVTKQPTFVCKKTGSPVINFNFAYVGLKFIENQFKIINFTLKDDKTQKIQCKLIDVGSGSTRPFEMIINNNQNEFIKLFLDQFVFLIKPEFITNLGDIGNDYVNRDEFDIKNYKSIKFNLVCDKQMKIVCRNRDEGSTEDKNLPFKKEEIEFALFTAMMIILLLTISTALVILFITRIKNKQIESNN